jgi:hypothetical protein
MEQKRLIRPQRNPLFEERGRMLDPQKIRDAFLERDAFTMTELAEALGYNQTSQISLAFMGKAPAALYRIKNYLVEHNIIPDDDYSKVIAGVIKKSFNNQPLDKAV